MTERSAVLNLIRERVRLRFAAVDAETFADSLIQKAQDNPGVELDLIASVSRLSLDDLYLAAACARNDEHAWAEFAALYFAFMKQFARRFLQEPLAGDVADQVIADLWQRGKIARYAGRSTLRTWLGAIVAHAAINAAKSIHVRAAPASDREFGRTDIVDHREPLEQQRESSRLLAKLIAEVIGDLGAEDKLLLLLHYEQGLTLTQMHRAAGGSRATLSRRLRDARRRLWVSLDALARQRLGAPAESLKDGIELAPLEFDLEAAVCAVRSVDERQKDVV